MFTRRIFDGVLLTIIGVHVASGVFATWARKELAAGGSPAKRTLGKAILVATR